MTKILSTSWVKRIRTRMENPRWSPKLKIEINSSRRPSWGRGGVLEAVSFRILEHGSANWQKKQ